MDVALQVLPVTVHEFYVYIIIKKPEFLPNKATCISQFFSPFALAFHILQKFSFAKIANEKKSEGHGRVDQVASVRERQIPPTHV